MDRGEKSANKTLSRRWQQRAYDRHRKALRGIGASVDHGPPKEYVHLHLKLKKLQVEEGT